ncbi:hypothetical protein SEA_POLLYWOG_49 [Mycobacterium phage Pollywog]|nr:hypothetical protein SEA_POLLYWOG_49 [Mycobacterium phage Pollywog]
MTYTADDYRKAADVFASLYGPCYPGLAGAHIHADRLDAEAAEQATLDAQVEELARIMTDTWFPGSTAESPSSGCLHAARTILTDGRWKRVEDV